MNYKNRKGKRQMKQNKDLISQDGTDNISYKFYSRMVDSIQAEIEHFRNTMSNEYGLR